MLSLKGWTAEEILAEADRLGISHDHVTITEFGNGGVQLVAYDENGKRLLRHLADVTWQRKGTPAVWRK